MHASSFSRRGFLTGSLAAGAGLLASTPLAHAATAASSATPKKPIRLALSSYSYWHFRTAKVSIETVIEKAAALGIGGVDVLHRQMDIPEREPLTDEHRAYLQKLKRHAFRNGVSLVCLSVHQDVVDPRPDYRRTQVEHTIKCI